MATRDPNFWRRFSVAVHNDEAIKSSQQGRPDLKHSYVSSPSPNLLAHTHPDLASPTSETPLSPAHPTHFTSSPMDSVSSLPTTLKSPTPLIVAVEKSTQRQSFPATMADRPPIRPKRQPSKLKKSPSTRSTAPLLPPHTFPIPPSKVKFASEKSSNKALPQPPLTPSTPSRYSLRCPSSLSLTGRSKNHFRTWTTITGGADVKCRDSWLEAQTRKKKQRTWICWCFWLGIMGLVAAVVVVILVLKQKKII